MYFSCNTLWYNVNFVIKIYYRIVTFTNTMGRYCFVSLLILCLIYNIRVTLSVQVYVSYSRLHDFLLDGLQMSLFNTPCLYKLND